MKAYQIVKISKRIYQSFCVPFFFDESTGLVPASLNIKFVTLYPSTHKIVKMGKLMEAISK